MHLLAGFRRRRTATTFAAVVAALVLAPLAAAAQLTPAIDASVGPERGGGTPLGALSPALRVDLARLAINASSDVPLSGALRGVAGRASVTAAAPIGGGWRLSGGAAVERGAAWQTEATWRGGAAAHVSYARGAGGVWIGGEAARVASVGGALPFRGLAMPNGATIAVADTVARGFTRLVDPAALRTTALSLGAWRSRGSWIGSVAVRTGVQRVPGRPPTHVLHKDSVLVARYDTVRQDDSVFITQRDAWEDRSRVTGDSGEASALRRLAEAETRLAWTRGHVAVVAAAGVRLADWARDRWTQGPNTASLGWATVDATVAVGRHAAVTIGAGTRPPAADVAAMLAGIAVPAAGRARYASFGVRLSPSLFTRPALPLAARPTPAAFDLRRAEPGRYVVRVRVPAARLVELSGDFTRWRPVAMQRVSADVWETVLSIPAGTHQVSIRVDGDAWAAPPGLARVADDFDGSAGVLVVP